MDLNTCGEVTWLHEVICSLICSITVTADSGAARGNQYPQWAEVRGLTRQAFQTECIHRYTKSYFLICMSIKLESTIIFLKLCRRPILENFVPNIAQTLLTLPKSVKSITLKSNVITIMSIYSGTTSPIPFTFLQLNLKMSTVLTLQTPRSSFD